MAFAVSRSQGGRRTARVVQVVIFLGCCGGFLGTACGFTFAPGSSLTKNHHVSYSIQPTRTHRRVSLHLQNDPQEDGQGNSGGRDGQDSSFAWELLRRAWQPVSDQPRRSLLFSFIMTASGAALGPFLDAYHSAFGVLTYDNPLTWQLWGSSPDHPALITAVWVPPLFGLAGFLIGWLYILGDHLSVSSSSDSTTKSNAVTSPGGPMILVGISFFCFQYWLSGILYGLVGLNRTAILNIMSILAAGGFWIFDGSFAGLCVSAMTAVGGPLIEVGLLSLSAHMAAASSSWGYHYNDPGETGFFPLWIAPVYFLGGPAVGNLARGYWNLLTSNPPSGDTVGSSSSPPETTSKKETLPPSPPCPVCRNSRCVSCPNCDGQGRYVAMGGRTIDCNCCKGRGLVLCRACFDHYGEDPYDLQSIRELMERMPD